MEEKEQNQSQSQRFGVVRTLTHTKNQDTRLTALLAMSLTVLLECSVDCLMLLPQVPNYYHRLYNSYKLKV